MSSPIHPQIHPQRDELEAIQSGVAQALAAWGLRPGEFQVVGMLPAMRGSVERPIIEIATMRSVVRMQPPDLTENDTLFRHAYMRHLADQGLPIPPLLPRPDGTTYALIDDDIYEVQGWLGGQPFVTDGPVSDERLVAAATTLGALHQAAADFRWRAHSWPEERSGYGLAQAYCVVIEQAGARATLPPSVANGLRQVAEACVERIELAADALAISPGPPTLHIHGDFQPHNLAFEDGAVSAIYDFDAARHDQRILELAYALLYFAGMRWEDDVNGLTPPLVDDGLDIQRVTAFLTAYGREAPPAEGEARLLADALTLVFPIVFANGAAEDLVFADDFEGEPDEEAALTRLQWAATFWLWLDRYRDALAQAWESGAGQ